MAARIEVKEFSFMMFMKDEVDDDYELYMPHEIEVAIVRRAMDGLCPYQKQFGLYHLVPLSNHFMKLTSRSYRLPHSITSQPKFANGVDRSSQSLTYLGMLSTQLPMTLDGTAHNIFPPSLHRFYCPTHP